MVKIPPKMNKNNVSYVKLQQAYVSESSAIGSWALIGYKGPGDNTKASGTGESATGAKSETTNFTYTDAASNVWTANNKTKLNDCAKGDNWTVTPIVATDNSEGEASFKAKVTDSCLDLTPTFETIGGFKKSS